MKLRRIMVGLSALCMLAFGVFAAQGASAAGQTAFTCAKNLGERDFGVADSHCSKTKVAVGTGEYGHVAFTGSTAVTGTNETTGGVKAVFKLKSVQSGVTLELQSTLLEGSGFTQNKEAGGEMFAHGTGFAIFKNVTVTVPASHGCIVKSVPVTTGEVATLGVVHTKELTATTEGLTNELKFQPVSGTVLAEFTVEGCSIAALNHGYALTGSVKGTTSGATTTFTHISTTTEGKLLLLGQKAGLEGTVTFKGPNGNGLALT